MMPQLKRPKTNNIAIVNTDDNTTTPKKDNNNSEVEFPSITDSKENTSVTEPISNSNGTKEATLQPVLDLNKQKEDKAEITLAKTENYSPIEVAKFDEPIKETNF